MVDGVSCLISFRVLGPGVVNLEPNHQLDEKLVVLSFKNSAFTFTNRVSYQICHNTCLRTVENWG